jgi:hypothetical protein
MLLVAVLLATGLFAPLLARQLTGGALLSGVLVVLAAWLVWHVARAWSQLAVAWQNRRQTRQQQREQQQERESVVGAASVEPSSADDTPREDGQSPFAGGDANSPEASQPPATGDDSAAGDQQEGGGRND